nr:phosphatidate cytidylyltransferase [Anaerofilum sp. An201]
MKPGTGDVEDISGKHSSELFVRIRTGAVLAVMGFIVLCLSHIHYVLNTVAASLSILGIYELLHAVRADTFPRMLILSLLSIIICFFEIPYYPVMLSIVWGIAVIAFCVLMKRIGRYHFASFVSILPCTLMLPLFFRSFVETRLVRYGLYYLILVILGCIINDVTAYFVGKAIGKRKLAPAISPGKTVEGGMGGLVASTLILTILSAVLSHCTGIKIRYGFLFLYLILASLVGQFGDLSMSVIKRSVGIKDFGKLLPGHGGVLDRFDSLLFVAPFAVIYCDIINSIPE